MRRHRSARLAAALVFSLLALTPFAGPVAAASVTFGIPTAVSHFGSSIDFTQPYSGESIKSAAILISIPEDGLTLPGVVGPSYVPLKGVGGGSLSFSLDTSNGNVSPFAPIVGQFEVVLQDGTIVDGPTVNVVYEDDRFAWKTKIGSVVRLHYIQASDSFAGQMLSLADAGVTKAAALFGVRETKPIDYYVYPSQSSFQQGLSEPGTVGGVALPSYRSCFAVVAPGDTTYAADVMPHEPTHIVFSDAASNPYHEPPRWLNEGLAQWVSQGYDSSSRSLVGQGSQDGTMPSLLALTDYFPLDQDRIFMAYAEAVAAVDLLVRTYGKPAIAKLVTAYRGGASDDEAFKSAFGVDVAAYASAFMRENGASSTKYGPQPAPTSAPGGATSDQHPSTAGPDGTQTPFGGGSSKAPADRSLVYTLAGLMALAGFVLLAAALGVVLSARSRVS